MIILPLLSALALLGAACLMFLAFATAQPLYLAACAAFVLLFCLLGLIALLTERY